MTAARLLLTADELSQLAKLADGRGRAHVDRDLISKLVVDHTVALNALRSNGIRIEEPAK